VVGNNDTIDAGGTSDQDTIVFNDVLDAGTSGDTINGFDDGASSKAQSQAGTCWVPG